MTPADLIALLARGKCHGERLAECETCQRREEAIALVERMAAVVEAVHAYGAAPPTDCDNEEAAMWAACERLDALTSGEPDGGDR